MSLDTGSVLGRLQELKEQRKRFKGETWLIIKNQKGELIHMSLSSSEVGKAIMKELEEGIEFLEDYLVAAE